MSDDELMKHMPDDELTIIEVQGGAELLIQTNVAEAILIEDEGIVMKRSMTREDTRLAMRC